MRKEIRQFIMRVLGWFGIFLLIVSLILESLPLMRSNALNTFHLIARQRVLEQRIVTDVLMLAYRPEDEHAEAISELQTALPAWEKVQNGLRNGDSSLGISPNLPSNVKMLLLQMQPDFTYMDVAARQILAHHDPIDHDQIAIVMQHEQPYYLAMAQAVQLLQDDINGVAQVYFSIELTLGIILATIWIAFIVSIRTSKKEEESS